MAAGLACDLAVFGAHDVAGWLPDVLVGWAFLGSALLLGQRSDAKRMALVTGAVGLAWFLGTVIPWLAFLHRGALVHLFFGYPTGRLSRLGRVVVPAAYTVAIFPGIWGDEWATVGLAVVLLAAVAIHLATAFGPIRRARQQAAMAAAAFGVLLISSALARLVFAQGEADRITYLAYAVALIAVAVATTVGVLRGTWRQAPVTDLVVQLAVTGRGPCAMRWPRRSAIPRWRSDTGTATVTSMPQAAV